MGATHHHGHTHHHTHHHHHHDRAHGGGAAENRRRLTIVLVLVAGYMLAELVGGVLPVLHDDILYVLTDSGMLSAFDAKTGKPHYQQQRLPKPYQFKASPVGANGKLYLASENDDVIVVRMGAAFEVLATNTLQGQTFIATPAIVDGEIYLRGQNTLFAIE